MTERELLEAAARAAGLDLTVDNFIAPGEIPSLTEEWGLCTGLGPTFWNPLTNDGDALRLAVKLRLVILIDDYRVRIGPYLSYPDLCFDEDATESQRCETVRLAIVTTAAAIGNKLEKSDE